MLLAGSRTLPRGWPAPAPTNSHRQARAGVAGPGTEGAARRAPWACPQTPSPAPRADSNELVAGVGATRSYLGAKGDRTHAGERKEREIKREREGDSAGAWELQEGRAK